MPAVIRQGRVIATCDVCGAMAHWGFGPLWACVSHRAEVELAWESEGSPPK
jgi:hypothetical protein